MPKFKVTVVAKDKKAYEEVIDSDGASSAIRAHSKLGSGFFAVNVKSRKDMLDDARKQGVTIKIEGHVEKPVEVKK